MTNRFLSSDLGREILARSKDLKIHLFRCGGELCATYELTGSVSDDRLSDVDDEDDGALLAKRKTSDAEGMRFIAELLRQFQTGGPS